MILRTAPLVAFVVLSAAFGGCFGAKGTGGGGGTPTAFFTVTPKGDGVTYRFDASNSSDPNGDDLMVEWNFGDGGTQTGPLYSDTPDGGYAVIDYTYAITNTEVMVSLVVRDPAGHAAHHVQAVQIGTTPNTNPDIVLRNATRWIKSGNGVVLDASRSIDKDGDLFSYEWILGNYSATPPAEASMMTGLLNMSHSFNQTFTTVGVYDYSCEAHPWMHGRVMVADGAANGTAPITVRIRNFAYADRTVTVGSGTTITFLNEDPAEHTATVTRFTPGKVTSTSPILNSGMLPAGSYQARLTLDDGKGGIASATYGLKSSDDAPANPFQQNYTIEGANGLGVNNLPGNEYGEHLVPDAGQKLDWPSNLTVSISWTDQTQGQSPPHWKVALYGSDKTTLITSCAEETLTCTLAQDVLPGTYFFKVTVSGNDANDKPVVSVYAIQWTKPDFGDSTTPAPTL